MLNICVQLATSQRTVMQICWLTCNGGNKDPHYKGNAVWTVVYCSHKLVKCLQQVSAATIACCTQVVWWRFKCHVTVAKWDFLTGKIRNIWGDILPYTGDTQELIRLIYFVQTEKNTKIKYNHGVTLQKLHRPLPLWETCNTRKPWKRQSQQRPSGSKHVLTSCTRADKTTVMNFLRVRLIRAGTQTQSEKMIFFEISWLQDVYTSTQVLAGNNSSLVFFSFEIEKREFKKTLRIYVCVNMYVCI